MLFQFCVTTTKLIKFTLTSDLYKRSLYTALESANFFVKEKLDNRTIVDTYFDFLKSGTFFLKCIFMLFSLNLESRILNPES